MSLDGAGSAVLSANHTQDGCFGTQRVERARTVGATPTAGSGIVRRGADVAWRAAGGGPALLQRAVPLPARRVARPVHVLAVYADGRSRTIYVPAAAQAAAAAHVELTQRNEALMLEISQINLELLRRRALE